MKPLSGQSVCYVCTAFIETKVNAVIDHIRGLKPSAIEQKHRVDRDSLRLWVKKAKAAMVAAFTSNPGRPSANHAESSRVSSQISQKSNVANPPPPLASKRTAVPQQCPLCGGTHLVRNGSYLSGGKRTPSERCSVLFVSRDNKNLLTEVYKSAKL